MNNLIKKIINKFKTFDFFSCQHFISYFKNELKIYIANIITMLPPNCNDLEHPSQLFENLGNLLKQQTLVI